MNVIFFVICVISIVICLIYQPQAVLDAMLNGANKSGLLCVTLLSIYSVWLGIFKVIEKSKLSDKICKLLLPIVKKLFKSDDKVANNYLALNMTANLLGMSGLATPLGIKACNRLDFVNNRYGLSVFFVLCATSIQLLPTSVMSLMAQYGSKIGYLIILPTLLCTTCSTALGLILCKVLIKNEKPT